MPLPEPLGPLPQAPGNSRVEGTFRPPPLLRPVPKLPLAGARPGGEFIHSLQYTHNPFRHHVNS